MHSAAERGFSSVYFSLYIVILYVITVRPVKPLLCVSDSFHAIQLSDQLKFNTPSYWQNFKYHIAIKLLARPVY